MAHKKVLPPGQTMTAAFYMVVLEGLQKRITRVRPAMADSRKLHRDNTPSHTAFHVTNYLAKYRVSSCNFQRFSSYPTVQMSLHQTVFISPDSNGKEWHHCSIQAVLRSSGLFVIGRITGNAVLTQKSATFKTINSIYQYCWYVFKIHFVRLLSRQTLYM